MSLIVVYRLCQCSLFKQFTTGAWASTNIVWLFIDYVNVLFSSNSQLSEGLVKCDDVVYRLCQCSLFKQFTTRQARRSSDDRLFIDYVNVLFSSNSQHAAKIRTFFDVVYRLCQCSLFKQFTTIGVETCSLEALFIDYVNVLFSSNSQHSMILRHCCLVVYRLCQCSLFKQFTTEKRLNDSNIELFIDYVNVLFSSNSQRTISFFFRCKGTIFFGQCQIYFSRC